MSPGLYSPTYVWSRRFVTILISGSLFGFLAHVARWDLFDGFGFVVDAIIVTTILAALTVVGILRSVISKDETLSEVERLRFNRSIRLTGPVGALEVFLVLRGKMRSSRLK